MDHCILDRCPLGCTGSCRAKPPAVRPHIGWIIAAALVPVALGVAVAIAAAVF